MIAPQALPLLVATFIISVTSTTVEETTQTQPQKQNDLDTKKIELFDGVFLKFPESNNTDKLISFELDSHRTENEGRGKKKGSKKLLGKLLPLFIMPFLIQSAIVPLFLSMLKFMLFKSLMVGKLALALIALNAFKNHNSFKGRDAEMANVHYGYHGNGMEEYGAYIN